MPLARYLGIEGGEVVIPGEHFGVGAVWAAAVPLGAAGDGGLVFMAFVADPPDFFVAGGGDVLWGEAAVFLWVPLAGDERILACEVVLARDEHFAGADWATAAVDTGRNNCAPFVAFVADPPDFAPGAGDDVARREIAVFGWVPLAGDIWIAGGEVGFAGDGPTAVAIRAACAAAASGMDGSLPTVSIRTAPPNVPFAAIAHAFCGQRQVALAVPLVKQFFAACAATEIGERFAHIDHLLQIKKQRDPQL